MKYWDKSKIYGYSDEVILNGAPEDNKISVDGCSEVLTREEIDRMFPNQFVILKDIKPFGAHWETAAVFRYHCRVTEFFENEDNALLTLYPTFSRAVEEFILAQKP